MTKPWFNRLVNDKNKKYYDFLQNVGPYPPDTVYHSHHIIPKFCFAQEDEEYMNSPANLILLSLEDHKKAHELLFEIYGDKRDAGAMLLLTGQTSEAKKLWKQAGAAATHKLLKEQGSNFWNPEFQKAQALKSMRKPNALQVRSQGGKKGGRNRNLNIAIKKQDRYIFSFNKKEYLCIFNCETGGDVVRTLHSIIPTELKRATPLLNGQRKSLYGWSCEKI